MQRTVSLNAVTCLFTCSGVFTYLQTPCRCTNMPDIFRLYLGPLRSLTCAASGSVCKKDADFLVGVGAVRHGLSSRWLEWDHDVVTGGQQTCWNLWTTAERWTPSEDWAAALGVVSSEHQQQNDLHDKHKPWLPAPTTPTRPPADLLWLSPVHIITCCTLTAPSHPLHVLCSTLQSSAFLSAAETWWSSLPSLLRVSSVCVSQFVSPAQWNWQKSDLMLLCRFEKG